MAALSFEKTGLRADKPIIKIGPLRAVHPLLFIICAVLLAPIISIVITAFGDTENLMPHLLQTVLGRYVTNTLILMAGVGALATLFGVSTAWIICRYRFPLRGLFEWMLMLPVAMPAYIIAYSYTDFLEYAGPVQTVLRALFGWQTSDDYWFFEIRSFGGAMLIMASVLYPYIYLLARTAFRQTSTQLFEVAAIAGKNIFWQVALPLARPAIIAGLSLVLMEVVSDFGTVDYFALETLTLGIFNVWLGMNNMPAAAQLALCAFLLIGMLLMIEIFARSRRSFQNRGTVRNGIPIRTIDRFGQGICMILCFAPIFIGFVLPVLLLLRFVMAGNNLVGLYELFSLAQQSLGLAFGVAILVSALGLIAGILAHYRSAKPGQILAAAAAAGYAFPGTILAIGVLSFAGFIDHLTIFTFSRSFLTGTLALLIFGLMVRFQAVGYGAVVAGIKRMPPHMMESSLILGHDFLSTVKRIILPLLKSSIVAGGLLVFVDVMKELPITLLLRPFSFETFATFTYQFAKDEMLEIAALPALFIVCAGLVPVYIANKILKY